MSSEKANEKVCINITEKERNQVHALQLKSFYVEDDCTVFKTFSSYHQENEAFFYTKNNAD